MKHTTSAQYRATALADVLTKQGRHQAWLAREMGVSRSFVTKLLKGARTVNEERVEQIARLVQVPAWLLFEPVSGMSSGTKSTSKDMVA